MTCEFLWPDFRGNFGQNIFLGITAFTMLISIPGNFLTIIVIIRNEILRNEPAYLLICSVCFADMIVATVAQPLYIVTLVIGSQKSCVIDHTFFTFAWLSSVSSTLGIIAVTLDRYVYIVYPLHYAIYMTKTKAKLLLVAVWIVSILYGIVPNFFHQELVLHSTTLSILILIALFMAYTYGQVYGKIKNGVNPPLPQSQTNTKQKRKLRGQTQATRTVLLIVMAFFGCWTPWVVVCFTYYLYNHLNPAHQFQSDSVIVHLHWIFLGVGYSNSAFNVYIYSKKNKVLNAEIRKFFGINNTTWKDSDKQNQQKKERRFRILTFFNQILKRQKENDDNSSPGINRQSDGENNNNRYSSNEKRNDCFNSQSQRKYITLDFNENSDTKNNNMKSISEEINAILIASDKSEVKDVDKQRGICTRSTSCCIPDVNENKSHVPLRRNRTETQMTVVTM